MFDDCEDVFFLSERVEVLTPAMLPNYLVRVCVLPDSIKEIADETFCKQLELEKLVFLNENGNEVVNKIEVIGRNAFKNTKLEEFIYSESLRVIEDFAFYKVPLKRFICKDEKGNIVLNKIQNIGIRTFSSTLLTYFEYSLDLKQLDSYAFCDTPIKMLLCKNDQGQVISNKLLPGKYLGDVVLKEFSWIEGLSKIDIVPNGTIYCGVGVHFEIDRNFNFVIHGEGEELDNQIILRNYKFTKPIHCNVLLTGHFSKISKHSLAYFRKLKVSFSEEIEKIPCDYFFDSSLSEKVKIFVQSNSKNRLFVNAVVSEEVTDIAIYKHIISCLQNNDQLTVLSATLSKEDWKILKKETKRLRVRLLKQAKEEEVLKPLESQKNLTQNVKQHSVNEIVEEIQNLISYFPNITFQQKLANQYNQIIMKYQEDLFLEKENIMNHSDFIFERSSIEILISELEKFRLSILVNQNHIFYLKKLISCKEMFTEQSSEKKFDSNTLQDFIFQILSNASIYPLVFQQEIRTCLENRLQEEQNNVQQEIEEIYESKIALNINAQDSEILFKHYLQNLLSLIKSEDFKGFISLYNELVKEKSNMPSSINRLEDSVAFMNFLFSEVTSDEFYGQECNTMKSEYNYMKECCKMEFDFLIKKSISMGIIDSALLLLRKNLAENLIYLTNTSMLPLDVLVYKHNINTELSVAKQCYFENSESEYPLSNTVTDLFLKEIVEKKNCLDLEDRNFVHQAICMAFDFSYALLKNVKTKEEVTEAVQMIYGEFAKVDLDISRLRSLGSEKVIIQKMKI